MAEIKWNQDAKRQAAQGAVETTAARAQRVLDSVLASERGKDAASIKATLAARWPQEVASNPSDEFLQRMAEQLAAGMRVVLRPGQVTPIDL